MLARQKLDDDRQESSAQRLLHTLKNKVIVMLLLGFMRRIRWLLSVGKGRTG